MHISLERAAKAYESHKSGEDSKAYESLNSRPKTQRTKNSLGAGPRERIANFHPGVGNALGSG
jgi:hypothetical protein